MSQRDGQIWDLASAGLLDDTEAGLLDGDDQLTIPMLSGGGSSTLSGLSDVDVTGLGPRYVMIRNEADNGYGFVSQFGDRYDDYQFVASDGLASAPGTWSRPTNTIANALGNIAAAPTTPEGAAIVLSPEDHEAVEDVLSVDGTFIQGLTPNASRLTVPVGAGFGLRIEASSCGLAVGKMRALDSAPAAVQDGIQLIPQPGQPVRFFRAIGVEFQQFGWDYNDGGTPATIDVGPAAIRMHGSPSGPNAFSDFHEFIGCRGFQNYRHVVMPGGGTNATFVGGVLHVSRREALYARRQERFAGGPTTAAPRFKGVFIVGDGQFTDGEYLVRIEYDPALGGPNSGFDTTAGEFDGCITEHSVDNNAGNHFFVSSGQNRIQGHRFIGGGDGTGPPMAVMFDTSSYDNQVIGGTFEGRASAGDPQFDDRGHGNSWPGSGAGMPFVTGPIIDNRFYTSEVASISEVTDSLTIDILEFAPVRFDDLVQGDRLTVEVPGGAGQAGDLIKIGLWSMGPDHLPANLLADSGSIDASGGGAINFDIAARRGFGRGTTYYLGVVGNRTGIAVSRFADGASPFYGRSSALNNVQSRRATVAHTFADPLPNPVVTTPAFDNTATPKILVRAFVN